MGRPKGSKNVIRFSEEEIKEIIRLYTEENIALYKLEKKFHTSSATLKRIFEMNNIKLKSFRESKRLYPFNESYFETIDSKDKAYFLGFLFADGCVSLGANGQYLFKLSLKDKYPILLFRKYLNSKKPICETRQSKNSYSSGGTIMYSLEYSSPKTFQDLCNLGCSPNKTFNLKFPNIPKELESHFIRGFFDGDGSVFLHKYNKIKDGNKIDGEFNYQLGVTFSGIHDFLEEVRIKANIPEKTLYKDERRKTDCWSIKILSISRCYNLYNYMYKDCGDLFLPRKKEIFDNFLTDRGSTTIIANPYNFDNED